VALTAAMLRTKPIQVPNQHFCQSTVRFDTLNFQKYIKHKGNLQNFAILFSFDLLKISLLKCFNFKSQVAPVITPFIFGEEEFNLDDSTSAMCSVTKGDLPLKIWWTFQLDKENEFPYNLTTGDGIVITKPSAKMSVLGIESVKSRHRGTYQCVVSNMAATVSHSAFLSINGSIL
jgi:hypothetical protein